MHVSLANSPNEPNKLETFIHVIQLHYLGSRMRVQCNLGKRVSERSVGVHMCLCELASQVVSLFVRCIVCLLCFQFSKLEFCLNAIRRNEVPKYQTFSRN
jgi:hypothetical protein